MNWKNSLKIRFGLQLKIPIETGLSSELTKNHLLIWQHMQVSRNR
jgi:hypothetical protein